MPNFIVKKMLQKEYEIWQAEDLSEYLNKREATLFQILSIFKKAGIQIIKIRDSGSATEYYEIKEDAKINKLNFYKNYNFFKVFKNNTKTNKLFAEFYNSNNFVYFKN